MNERELATVLAALRYWQDKLINGHNVVVLMLPHFETCTPLTIDEIDDLCERLNVEEEG
jgi:hypothetical protein